MTLVSKSRPGAMARYAFLSLVLACLLALACGSKEQPLAPETSTWAELREVRRGALVNPPRGRERAPYPRERLVDGERVVIAPGGLVWLRLDTGTTLLVRGPARLRQRPRAVELEAGRAFVDTPPGVSTELVTPRTPLTLASVRASVEVREDGASEAYVLRGEVRAGGARARAGERLSVGRGAPQVAPAVSWEDWTGGLATTDRPPAPPPFGVGTVGARRPGDQGSARFPLAIQKLDVRVRIQADLAITEVEQTFFNPVSEVVEGIYGLRIPPAATLERFGVDRAGDIAWGRVKERAAASAQYESNVYAGSTEDPALLEWDSPGVYRARLYPIQPGETRRIVIRYTEWLTRTGKDGERRVYVYPMAAEGAEESLPHIEELAFSLDLGEARASLVRMGMAGARRGNQILVRAQDLVPRADLAVELFDSGQRDLVAYRTKHTPDLEPLPRDERVQAQAQARKEPDYLLLPLRAAEVPLPQGGLDLAVVVDASAATDPASLAIARAATTALLAHLGKDDRVALWAGADSLRPLVERAAKLVAVDPALRTEAATALSRVEAGGATDLGTLLGDAAMALEPARRGAVVYIGDGRATVGELSLDGLRARLGKLPRPVRIYALGVGESADLGVLQGLARGGFAERVEDGHGAARATLTLLEHAERPAWLGAGVDLGAGVERVYPRDTSAWIADESVLVVGRIAGKDEPKQVKLKGPAGAREVPLVIRRLDDRGDLRRRWGLGRLAQLFDEDAGHAALVDLGTRHGLITPVTSLYVPTTSELASGDYESSRVAGKERKKGGWFDWLWGSPEPQAAPAPSVMLVEKVVEQQADDADDKEGGEGARAKGEEGAMGNPTSKATGKRYSVRGRLDSPDPHIAREAALREAQNFGMIGLTNVGDAGAPPPATAAASAAPVPAREPWGRDASLASKPSSGFPVEEARRESAPGGQGFGSGHGRLGGPSTASAADGVAPWVRIGSATIAGRLAPEVVQRIVRQRYGHFRLCYERGLGRNPNLEGRLAVRFAIGADGRTKDVESASSTLPDTDVVDCYLNSFRTLSFPVPEGGTVAVVFPFDLAPRRSGGAATPAPIVENVSASLVVRTLPRVALFCGAAAALPLAERVLLWRERLGKARDSASAVAAVYSRALRDCEATTPRERVRLLGLMLDAMSTVEGQVELWRLMQDQLGAADVLYRGILARVKTPEQHRELYAALGLKRVDPGLLSRTLRETKAPAERVRKLRALRRVFPDDLVLALRLLDALEDAGDPSGARELARELRARSDADTLVRTGVGELYLRLAARALDPNQRAELLARARRAFGEIVEFAPSDPVARRRLGDLLRAHGWHGDARRQYESLAQLTPDDPSVALLIAAAAQGEGRLEEAVRWTEKGRDAGAPDLAQGPAATARIAASTFLAWGRREARAGKRQAELERLIARARRVLPKGGAAPGTRVTLSWTHPDFHPGLWSNALGTAMPSSTGDATLGLFEVVVPAHPGAFVEIRVEPDELEAVARLGAEAVLTVVFDELGKDETVVRLPVRFEPGGPPSLRFRLEGREVIRG